MAIRAAAFAALLIGLAAPARADTIATASYVVNLGGTIIASAEFDFLESGDTYSLGLDAKVTGIAQLVASGTARANSAGTTVGSGLRSSKFDLTTRTSDGQFAVNVQFADANVSAFQVNPPIVNNIDRVPIERSQLRGVNDALAAFLLKGEALDGSLCNYRAKVFSGVERFDLSFSYAKDDVATSARTGYQGPVVLCRVKYTPISGHYTTSEITNGLKQDDRILIWYAPLRDTGWFLPYRVLLTTSQGDLSMVLTDLD